MNEGAVSVRGLKELNAAFAKLGADMKRELKLVLTKAAAPVADTAAQKAWNSIRNMDEHWSRMKVGVSPASVYIAPFSRRRGGSPRPNLGTLLMDRAMQPALDEHAEEIVGAVDAALDEIAAGTGF